MQRRATAAICCCPSHVRTVWRNHRTALQPMRRGVLGCGRCCNILYSCSVVCCMNMCALLPPGVLHSSLRAMISLDPSFASSSRRSSCAATRNVRRATCNGQHAACNGQHAACNMQSATCSVQHAACNMQRATCNRQHATDNGQHRPAGRSCCATAHVVHRCHVDGICGVARVPCVITVASTLCATPCLQLRVRVRVAVRDVPAPDSATPRQLNPNPTYTFPLAAERRRCAARRSGGRGSLSYTESPS